MPLINCIPVNSGGGRRRNEPQVTVYPNGQIIFNHEASVKLGNPSRVLVKIFSPGEGETGDPYILVTPTIPGDSRGYSFSGGGNTQHRIKLSQYKEHLRGLEGKLTLSKRTGVGIILQKAKTE